MVVMMMMMIVEVGIGLIDEMRWWGRWM